MFTRVPDTHHQRHGDIRTNPQWRSSRYLHWNLQSFRRIHRLCIWLQYAQCMLKFREKKTAHVMRQAVASTISSLCKRTGHFSPRVVASSSLISPFVQREPRRNRVTKRYVTSLRDWRDAHRYSSIYITLFERIDLNGNEERLCFEI